MRQARCPRSRPARPGRRRGSPGPPQPAPAPARVHSRQAFAPCLPAAAAATSRRLPEYSSTVQEAKPTMTSPPRGHTMTGWRVLAVTVTDDPGGRPERAPARRATARSGRPRPRPGLSRPAGERRQRAGGHAHPEPVAQRREPGGRFRGEPRYRRLVNGSAGTVREFRGEHGPHPGCSDEASREPPRSPRRRICHDRPGRYQAR